MHLFEYCTNTLRRPTRQPYGNIFLNMTASYPPIAYTICMTVSCPSSLEKRAVTKEAPPLQVISDLLKPERSNLQVRDDRRRGTFVEGLSEWVVRNAREVETMSLCPARRSSLGATPRFTSSQNYVCRIPRALSQAFHLRRKLKTAKDSKMEHSMMVSLDAGVN